MRHYRSRCKIYIFGFSRGAYTARFLNEMLDYVGLLGPDNEEMIPFVWEAFATWKLSSPHETGRRTAYNFLKVCRETVCRPVCRVQFLGLFDAVNSIAKFQVDTEGMPHSRFIRHAVSIDERRVKFQPVLFRPGKPSRTRHSPHPPADSEQPAIARASALGRSNAGDDSSDDEAITDIQEVWFPGDHSDIGGGWKSDESERWALSHGPLVWMVQEAQRAGLQFDSNQLLMWSCRPLNNPSIQTEEMEQSGYRDALRLSATEGVMHDRLEFGQGLPVSSVLLWRLMEYIPLARMKLQDNGSWRLVHWPAPLGEVRAIPLHAEIHRSAIQRMQFDPNYRPGNLIVGGGGRGVRIAPKEHGIGEWVVIKEEGDPAREIFLRKAAAESERAQQLLNC